MDIPDDVMRAAKAEIAKGDMAFITVARAILAERRRCADVAKAARNSAEFFGNTDMMHAATLIKRNIEASQ